MWHVYSRAGVVAWRSSGSTGGALPPGSSGVRQPWRIVTSGAPMAFAWPKPNGTGGTTVVGGNPWQWRGVVSGKPQVFAWRQPRMGQGATPTPTTKRIRLQLNGGAGLSGLKYAVFESTNPAAQTAPALKGSDGVIDGGALFELDVSTLSASVGSDVWLTLTNSDGTSAQSPVGSKFSGPVRVVS